MGNHRAERRGPGRGPSKSPAPSTPYVGRRVAGRPVDLPVVATEPLVLPVVEEQVEAPAFVLADPTYVFQDSDVSAELPPVRAAAGGKRKAVKHAGSRGPLFKGVPSAPVLLGLATLAVAVGGTLTAGTGAGAELTSTHSHVGPATALGGDSNVASVNTLRGPQLDRTSDRQALQQASDSELVEAAEAAVEERNVALSQLTSEAQKQARKLADDRWVVPLHPVILTARFGEYGLWSSYHTGLDFNGETGDPIHSIAAGTVTFVGYDGSYGNKTVVTLDDGTELWYCHQTTQYVSVGDRVTPDEIIGTVGATGHVTGSHLHVEVRPGGGDPVDPYAAFVQHGVVPEQG